MKSSVIVRTRFARLHRWPTAPSEVAFLRDHHRHVFHVELEVSVSHDDREIEFIIMKQALDDKLMSFPERSPYSCEMIAGSIIKWVHAHYGKREVSCSVFEDGENGARVRT